MACDDPVPMVRWHMAMMFGNLATTEEEAKEMLQPLSALLGDSSVFAQSWAIVSLVLIGKKFVWLRGDALAKITALQYSPSKAIRTKVATAMRVLGVDGEPVPLTGSRQETANERSFIQPKQN
jgi:hypothetical protein